MDVSSPIRSILEDDAAEVLAPKEVIEEELQLERERHNRENEENEAHAHDHKEVEKLEGDRFASLEKLLSQAGMYSEFLNEQIIAGMPNHLQDKAREVEVEGPPTSGEGDAKSRRGGQGPGSEGGHRADKNEEGPTLTQRLFPSLRVELRDYQIKGVQWILSLYCNGINGILADQMGLGKTIQTIAFLSHLKDRGINGPFMIIAPLSTLANWISEFHRFCPSMRALMYHGSKQQRENFRNLDLRDALAGNRVHKDFPVLVTSYEIIIADSKFLNRINFKYVVVDEGHRLKSFDCKLIRELKTIPAENKLLLSGTPLQNNLAELWSLLNYIMPTIFTNLSDFQDWFDFNLSKEGADQEIVAAEQRHMVVTKLHSILKPFMLRRLKSDVNIALPKKMEVLLYCRMTKEQKKLNEKLLDGSLKEDMQELADKEGLVGQSTVQLNNVLMQMRKICNHPDLITSAFTADTDFPTADELVRQSGKMQMLEKLLGELHPRGHKVLIFSQMTKMLDLIESYLEERGHRACRIDGSIPWQERQQNIDDFNSDPDTWLFLLSTRAGGLGINLTSADTVIIFDSDWNPHQDLQAMDRCHRLGQSRPVLVLRLATAHSVEGRMLRRAGDKMALERLVIKKGAFLSGAPARHGHAGGAAGAGADSAAAAGAGADGKDDRSERGMSAAELVELLRADVTLEDVPQSGVVSDEQLSKILDRSFLEHGAADVECPYPLSGVGYEVIQGVGAVAGTGLLQDLNHDEESAPSPGRREEGSQEYVPGSAKAAAKPAARKRSKAQDKKLEDNGEEPTVKASQEESPSAKPAAKPAARKRSKAQDEKPEDNEEEPTVKASQEESPSAKPAAKPAARKRSKAQDEKLEDDQGEVKEEPTVKASHDDVPVSAAKAAAKPAARKRSKAQDKPE